MERKENREREREFVCSGLEEKKRMKGVNGRRFKDTNYPRKLKLSNAGDYILGGESRSDLTSYKAGSAYPHRLPLRDQLDRAFYEAIKIKACLVHS